jgi:hypothetical protein
LGALSFMLSGYVVSLYPAGALLAGGALVPWVLVALDSKLGDLRAMAAAALLVALQALSGDPQSVLFSLLAVLVWGAAVRPQWLRLGAAAGAFGFGGLLAAVQLVPSWELLHASTRAGASPGELLQWSTHPIRLAELFSPFPFGGYLEKPQFWAWFSVHGPSSVPFALSVYLGASTLLLGICGVRKDRWAVLALALAALGLLLALGPSDGLGTVLTHAPGLRLFRYPEKYLYLTSLGWGLLVGMGAARMPSLGPRELLLRFGPVLLGIGVLFAQLDSTETSSLLATLDVALARHHVTASRTEVLALAQKALLGTLAMFATSGLGAFAARLELRGFRYLPLLLLVAFDLVSTNRRIVYTEERDLFEHEPAVAALMRARLPTGARFLRENPAFALVKPQARDPDEMTSLRAFDLMTLKSNLGGVFSLEEVGGYGAVALTRYEEMFQALRTDPVKLAGVGAACFLLTSTESTLGEDSRVGEVATWPSLRLLLLAPKACVPRLHGVERTEGVLGLTQASQALRAPSFEPATVAVVEGEQSAAYSPLMVSRLEERAGDLWAHVTVPPGDGLLVNATSYEKGWKVEVDGTPAPVFAVNVGTMGVRLPTGTHDVHFHFRTPGLTLGSTLSALGALAWLAAAFLHRRR